MKLTPLKAIRQKCLDCTCDNKLEIRECSIQDCPLYVFRFGKNPSRAGIGNKTALLVRKPPLNERFNDQDKGWL